MCVLTPVSVCVLTPVSVCVCVCVRVRVSPVRSRDQTIHSWSQREVMEGGLCVAAVSVLRCTRRKLLSRCTGSSWKSKKALEKVRLSLADKQQQQVSKSDCFSTNLDAACEPPARKLLFYRRSKQNKSNNAETSSVTEVFVLASTALTHR